MRPGDFSPGNPFAMVADAVHRMASMRPGDFSPGNALPAGDVEMELDLLQ